MDVLSLYRPTTFRKIARQSSQTDKPVYGVVLVGGEPVSVWAVRGFIEVAMSERGERWNWPEDRILVNAKESGE